MILPWTAFIAILKFQAVNVAYMLQATYTWVH